MSLGHHARCPFVSSGYVAIIALVMHPVKSFLLSFYRASSNTSAFLLIFPITPIIAVTSTIDTGANTMRTTSFEVRE